MNNETFLNIDFNVSKKSDATDYFLNFAFRRESINHILIVTVVKWLRVSLNVIF